MIKLPFGVDIHNLIDDLRILSWEAADLLLYYSKIAKDSSAEIEIIQNTKVDNPVTLADLEVNELIIQRIKGKYTDINWEILSEEYAKNTSYKCDINSDWLWILDPLDGTKDCIQGTSDYAMHLALNYKRKPYLGIVLLPEKNELWIANGNGVWCERRDGSISKPKIFKKKSLSNMTLVTSKNHRNQTLINIIEKISFKKVSIIGSIGCKIASIIRGDSDIYISLSLPDQSSPKDWDFAAPEAILKAAGGDITYLNNKKLIYNNKNFEQPGIIIASNDKNTHKIICSEIKEIIKEYDLYPLHLLS